MRSGSSWPSNGNGPMPSIPFSDCRTMCVPAGMKLATSVGMPMPRLTYIPSDSSCAARRATWSRVSGGMSGAPLADGPLFDRFFELRALDDPLHVDAGRVHGVGLQLPRFDENLDLRDGRLAGGRHHRVEVARRLPVHEVAEPVALPR